MKIVAESTKPKALWLTPNTGTNYIGWTLGLEKIATLKKTVEESETR